MEEYRKVIWAEGTLLAQQHFQCWDKQLQAEHSLDRQFDGEDNWGIAELKVDEHLLAQGQFKIRKAKIRFPDQRWFSYHQSHEEPLIRTLPDRTDERMIVYLGLELSDNVSGINGYEQAFRREAAWQADYQQVQDIYDSQRSREVLLAALKPRICWQNECPENVSLVPVAEIIFNHQLHCYCLNEQFIPPMLRLAGAEASLDFIKRCIALVDAAIARLNNIKNKQISNDKAALILVSLSAILCRLRVMLFAMLQAANIGPYQFYQNWICCLGELTGFLDDPLAEPALPEYLHRNLTATFSALLSRFEDLIQRVIPADTASIVLQQQSDGSWISDRISIDDLRQKQFCLAIYSEEINEQMLEKIQHQIKISAPGKLHSIVHSFSAGLSLSPLKGGSSSQFLSKRHYHYFKICQQGNGWNEILEERKMAFFTGPVLMGSPIELIAY